MAKVRKSKSTKNLRDLRDPLDYPETRIERYLQCIKTGDNTDLPSTVNTRIERYLYCIATGDNSTLPDHPETMIELYLDAIATGNVSDLPHDPQDRLQRYLYAAAYVDSSLLPSADYTRLEKYISSILGGTMFVTEQTPYLFRVSGGEENANVKHKELDTLVGVTMPWNQRWSYADIPDDSNIYSDSSYTANNVTFTKNNDGSISIQTNAEGASADVLVKIGNSAWNNYNIGNIIKNHVHFICGVVGGSASTYCINYASTRNTYAKGAIFPKLESGYNMWLKVFSGAIITTPVKIYPNIIDLTLMLTPTIADYVYTLESGTPGAGVEWLKAHGFFTKPYYAYDDGSLQSVCVSAHIMRDADDQIIASYPLDHSVTRRGIYKLDENNKLYADGDTDDGKGTMTVKYGVVDLGTLTWTKGTYAFYSDGTGLKTGSTNVVCAKYPNVGTMSGADMPDKSISPQSSGRIYIKDSIYSDEATFTTAMSGVYLVYELATPTTETVEPFINPQQVDKAGTEEYVDFPYFVEDRDVEVPVGHVTQYPQ